MRKKLILNQKGISLVETVVSAGLLALVGYVAVTMQANSFKVVGQVADQAAYTRAISSIQNEILSDHRFMPQQTNLASLDAAAADARVALEQSFAAVPANVLETRCYDNKGGRTLSARPQDCFFRVSFYKVTIKDRSMPATSNIRNLPMSRINARIQFTENAQPRTTYISRLVTDIISY